MTWLVNELNRRILFMEQTQVPNSEGGLTQTYKQLAKVWANLKPVGTSVGSFVRNVQVGDVPTHKFKVRRNRAMGVDTYGTGFVQADTFVFLLGDNSPTVGRLFRIMSASNENENDEAIEFLAKEMGQLDTTRGVII